MAMTSEGQRQSTADTDKQKKKWVLLIIKPVTVLEE